MQRFKKLLLNGYIIAHISTFGISIITSVVAVKIFSSKEYVEFMTAFAVINFLVPMITMGASAYIIRTVKINEEVLGLKADISVMLLLGCLVAGSFLYAYMYFFENMKIPFFYVFSAAFFLAVINVASASYRAESNARKYFVTVAGSKLFILFSIVFFWNFSILSSASSTLALAIVLSSGVVILLLKGKVMPQGGWVSASLSQPLYFSVPLVVGNLIVLFYPFYERTLLSRLDDFEEVGVYVFVFDFGLKLVSSFLIFMKVIVFPRAMEMTLTDGEVLIKKMRTLILLGGMAGVSLLLSLWFFWGDIVYAQFSLDGDVFLYVCMALMLGVITILSYTSLIKLVKIGNTYPVAIAGAGAVAIYALSVESLINDFGVKGAGVAMVGCALINALSLEAFYLSRKKNAII